MKRITWTFTACVLALLSCKKSNDASQVSLTPSVTQATVGQTVSVTLSSNTNSNNWSVSPATHASLSYGTTTSKVNYVTFSAPGSYTVSVKTGEGRTGGCTHGIDSASVTITVVDK